jgi:1,4-alpha-glucan branching enzyme
LSQAGGVNQQGLSILQLMIDWVQLDEQWRERSEQMFKRCVKEPDLTKAQLAWDAACKSEQRRLEWKSLCLQQDKRFKTSNIVSTG